MAQVKLEEIIDHLDTEVKAAIAMALLEVAPSANIDPHAFFRSFHRAVGRKTSTWETVPDHYVER